MAGVVSKVAIEITQRQETRVSHSDISRGFTEALQQGLTVVDYELASRVCLLAHALGRNGHTLDVRQGSCLACSSLYEVVNDAVATFRRVET